MYETMTFHRVIVFGKPKGPWRLERVQAQRDAEEMGLGSFEPSGTFYITVPADIERLELPVRLLRRAMERADFERAERRRRAAA
jgi:hypothetical protein